jgi:hypothetical protein
LGPAWGRNILNAQNKWACRRGRPIFHAFPVTVFYRESHVRQQISRSTYFSAAADSNRFLHPGLLLIPFRVSYPKNSVILAAVAGSDRRLFLEDFFTGE